MAAQSSAPPERRALYKTLLLFFQRFLSSRRQISTPVQVVAREVFPGRTESISFSGASVRLNRDLGPLRADLRNLDLVFPELREMRVTVEVVDYQDKKLELRFKNLSTKDRGDLVNWIEAQERDAF